jgi:DNA helicase II / ATP-dependent DNA helicase PcrA
VIEKVGDCFMQIVSNRKGRFLFTPGKCTKNIHEEYSEYPRSHNFEQQFYADTIELAKDKIETIESKKHEDYTAGVTIHTNKILSTHDKEKLPILENQMRKPYFGRIDIVGEDGIRESIYIGHDAMGEDIYNRVYSIKSVYGSIYNQSKVGKVETSKFGNIDVLLFRQIENENGILIHIYDKEWSDEKGYLDPILLKRLNDQAKGKLNEISSKRSKMW